MKKRLNLTQRAATLATGVTALGAVAIAAQPAVAAPAARPNVVVILVDDMGWSDIGCYGSEIPTPNLDNLAATGLRFTQFYNTARCSPSRASLITGLYPHRAGLGYLEPLVIKDSEGTTGRLSDRAVTIGEALQPAGYFTAMSGKWHMGQTHGTPPWKRGFDRSLSSMHGAIYFPDQKPEPNNPLALNGEELPLDSPKLGENWYSTTLFKDFGLRFIDEAQQAKKPFFLYLPFCAPHFPLMAPQADIAKFKGKYLVGWDKLRAARYQRQIQMGLIDPKWPLSARPPATPAWDTLDDAEKERFDGIMSVYAAMVSDMDKSVGMLVDGLKKRGVYDNTLILFMSDNGGNAESGPRGIAQGDPLGGPQSNVFEGMDWATLSNTPFRRYKHFIHEGGISTPLIAHWPDGIPKSRNGQLEKQPGHFVDIMPTVLAVTGAKYPTTYNGHQIYPMDGVSLIPDFAGKKQARSKPIFWEHEGNRGVRNGKWKLVSKYLDPWELYDVEADRTEQHDLVKQQPKLVAKMGAQWDAWAKSSHVDQWTGPRRADWGDVTRESANDAGSHAASFDLRPGATLPRERAPRIAERDVEISAQLGARSGDGVLVAQGGSQDGLALYVSAGKLAVALRSDGKLTTLTAPDALPAGPIQVGATLSKTGALTLRVAGKTVAQGQAPKPLLMMPTDGLQVGRDEAGQVGNYTRDNAFQGDLQKVIVELK